MVLVTIDVNLAPKELTVSCVFVAIGCIAIILRFVARHITKAGYGWDDWTILIACIVFLANQGLGLRAIIALLGAPRPGAPDKAISVLYAKFRYLQGTLYWLSIGTTNISVLLLYQRIFLSRQFHLLSTALICVNVLWTIPGTFVQIFDCQPIQRSWESGPKSCLQYGYFHIVMMVAEVIFETCMIALPIREVRKLHLSTRRKFVISAIFFLGGFVLVTDIVRVVVCYAGPNTIDFNEDSILASVHIGTAILSACLPTYGTLISHICHKFTKDHVADSEYVPWKWNPIRASTEVSNKVTIQKGLATWITLESHAGSSNEDIGLAWLQESIPFRGEKTIPGDCHV